MLKVRFNFAAMPLGVISNAPVAVKVARLVEATVNPNVADAETAMPLELMVNVKVPFVRPNPAPLPPKMSDALLTLNWKKGPFGKFNATPPTVSVTVWLVVLIWKANVPDKVKTPLMPIERTVRLMLAAKPEEVISIAPNALTLMSWLPRTVAVKVALALTDNPVLPIAR